MCVLTVEKYRCDVTPGTELVELRVPVKESDLMHPKSFHLCFLFSYLHESEILGLCF